MVYLYIDDGVLDLCTIQQSQDHVHVKSRETWPMHNVLFQLSNSKSADLSDV
jgi:hypothetical protein